MKIFSGTSNLHLAESICKNLNVPLGEIYHHTFPSGELYCQFKENLRGEDVFLINGSSNNDANDHLMQLLIMCDAARRSSAARISAVMPVFSYQRQDRKTSSRTPISSRLVMDLLASSGCNRILTMELHAPQIQGFTNLPIDVLSFEPILIDYIKKKHTSEELKNIVIMAPDVGAIKRVTKYSELLNCDFGFVAKKRISDTEVELQSIIGDVKHKHVYLVDDMSESAGTLIQAAKACKDNGANFVTAAIVHNYLTDIGMERLSNNMPNPNIADQTPCIDEFIASNTINHWWSKKYKPSNIVTLDVSELFSKAIYNTHKNQSISELFV